MHLLTPVIPSVRGTNRVRKQVLEAVRHLLVNLCMNLNYFFFSPLARRGLMLGERVEAKYSGSDTDSDTEEYCANAHKINPVTGHVEPPRKSPFEGKN